MYLFIFLSPARPVDSSTGRSRAELEKKGPGLPVLGEAVARQKKKKLKIRKQRTTKKV